MSMNGVQKMIKRFTILLLLSAALGACDQSGGGAQQTVDAAKLEQIKKLLAEDVYGGGGGPGDPNDPTGPGSDGETFVRLKLNPPTLDLIEGTTIDFRVIAERRNTKEFTLSEGVTFELDDTSLAQIDDVENSARYDLIALKPGKTRILVRYQALETEVQLEVHAKSLISIDVVPKTVLLGTPTRFSLNATYDNGTQEPVTGTVQWESSDLSGITFAGSTLEPSIFLGKKVGLFGVKAQYQGSSIVSRTRVQMPQLASIRIEGDGSTFLIGTNAQLRATGTFLNGESFDISSSVTWSTEDGGIITLDSSGNMEAVTPGDFSVKASFDNVTGEGNFFVTNVSFASFRVVPTSLSAPIGTEASVKLYGVLQSGAQQDITDFAQWRVLDEALAQHGGLEDPPVKGKIAALQKGSTTLRARYGQTQFDIPLVITDAALSEIRISSDNPDGQCGVNSPQFRAEGLFSDDSRRDVTGLVTWSVDPPSQGVASQDPATKGLITTTAPGNAHVVASYQESNGPRIEARSPIKIGPAKQTGVGITAPANSLALGESMQLAAGTIMSCGPGQDFTREVTWTSLDPTRIDVSNGQTTKGFLTTKGTVAGVMRITVKAEKADFAGTLELELRPKEVKQITVKPTKLQIVAKGDTTPVVLEGRFTDDSVADITNLSAYPGYSVQYAIRDCSLPPCATIHATSGLITSGANEGQVRPSATLTLPTGKTVTSSQASVRVVSKCTTGVLSGFYCTFLGSYGQSCQQVCSNRGFTYHEATSFFFGLGGDPNDCSVALRGLGYTRGLENTGFSSTLKVGCAIWDVTDLAIQQSVRESSGTATATASDPGFARVCACSEP